MGIFLREGLVAATIFGKIGDPDATPFKARCTASGAGSHDTSHPTWDGTNCPRPPVCLTGH